jgi:hypothetical protein
MGASLVHLAVLMFLSPTVANRSSIVVCFHFRAHWFAPAPLLCLARGSKNECIQHLDLRRAQSTLKPGI